jgi:hypothetical protein
MQFHQKKLKEQLAAMAIEGSDQDKINEIKKEVEAAGLQKYQPPKPLEIVAENQVKLVCWMAVKAQ